MADTQTLKQKILEAQEAGDIAALYVLEGEASEQFDEKTLIAYYANILDLALENLTEALGAMRKMRMDDVRDFATLRALYEYAVEHYSAGQAGDAGALFEILAGLTDDARFAEAMRRHLRCTQTIADFERFLETAADLETTQRNGTFFISAFMPGACADEAAE